MNMKKKWLVLLLIYNIVYLYVHYYMQKETNISTDRLIQTSFLKTSATITTTSF